METRVRFLVNGGEVTASTTPADPTLLRFLRDKLRLMGAKNGCGGGHCGTCIVIIDGKATRSCLVRLSRLEGKRVETVEGLSRDGQLHPLQEAFIDLGAVQCGFCTPGALMAAKALLDRNLYPSEEDCKKSLEMVVCRCGAYHRMIQAIQVAAERLRGEPRSFSSFHLGQRSDVVGLGVERKGDRTKVTGQLKYADDMYFGGMLHGKILWSAHPHARITAMETSAAQRMPGVVAVLTAGDVPGPNDLGKNQPVLCDKKVRFIGDPVAAVFAETPEQAQAALNKIRVEYQPLPAVFSPFEAMAENAPAIHDKGNLEAYVPFHKGNVPQALAEADIIVEGSYYTPFIEHAYLETEAGVAVKEGDRITMWIGSMNPRGLRDAVAKALSLPPERLRFAETPSGGAFGGKLTVTIHAILALGVLKTGRPCKVVLSRAESLRMHPKRNAVHLEYKTAAKRDGRLTAVEARIVSDQGAYSALGRACLEQMMVFGCGPYVVPNAKIDGYCVYTNKVPGGAMRGFGDNMAAFAVESQMDKLARALDMDPFELRLKNALSPGDFTAAGQLLKASVPMKEVITKAREAFLGMSLYRTKPGQRIGVGMASAFKNVGGGGTFGAIAEVTPQGDILLRVGCPDVGQGSNTIFAQMAAQVLGVSYEKVRVIHGDTHETPPSSAGTGGQRVTVNMGNAVLKASYSLKAKLNTYVARQMGVEEKAVALQGDGFVDTVRGHPLVTLPHLARLALSEGEELRAEEYYTMPPTHSLSLTGNTDGAIDPQVYANYFSYSYCTHVAVVTVDERTGEVKVRKLIAVHDVGRALNPRNCETQVEGSVMMGLGYALSEEFVIEDGVNATDTLKKCGIPGVRELPEVDVILVEDPQPGGPFFAKGISEVATVPTTPAIINAIYDAIGVRIQRLPATPQRVLAGLKQKRGHDESS
ncbi:MAG: molybdopterin-dependent oxidoreductase [Chloroflexi bacterium]|nr:molybdopterin-dependent oxidoreductase [Chloroflexota bacterium]